MTTSIIIIISSVHLMLLYQNSFNLLALCLQLRPNFFFFPPKIYHCFKMGFFIRHKYFNFRNSFLHDLFLNLKYYFNTCWNVDEENSCSESSSFYVISIKIILIQSKFCKTFWIILSVYSTNIDNMFFFLMSIIRVYHSLLLCYWNIHTIVCLKFRVRVSGRSKTER